MIDLEQIAPPSRLAPPVVACRIGGGEVVEEVAAEWRDLSREAANDEPFYRPEFFQAHLRAFAPRARVALLTARSENRLVAVLPLIEERVLFHGLPARRLRGVANVHSYRFDMLRAAGDAGQAAVGALWKYLATASRWDLLEFPYVPDGGSLEELAGMAAAEGYPTASREVWRTPYIPTGDWDGTEDFWIRRAGSNFRHTMRRIGRKFESSRTLRFWKTDTADAGSLRRFYELEASGWKGGDGTAIQCEPPVLQFYNEVAAAAARSGYLALCFLEIDGETAAAHFAFRYGQRYLVLKCAYNERWSELAPGHLIVNRILQDCGREGLVEFDFLGPSMEWKRKWTSAERQHSAFYVFRRDLYGAMLHAAAFKLRPRLAAWKRRLAGGHPPEGRAAR
jgi:CelD/BcsL family acetyltransferase involved in cellulose biosynthesis